MLWDSDQGQASLSRGQSGHAAPPAKCLWISGQGTCLCLFGTCFLSSCCVSCGGWRQGAQGRLPGGGSKWAEPGRMQGCGLWRW